MLRKSVVINRPQGLGARPIAELVQVASKYESRVYLEHGRRKVNAKSIMGMMSLEASVGDSIEVMMQEITAYLLTGRMKVSEAV